MPAWTDGLSWLHYDYRQNISYVYINIPKNASSWMKENFGGFEYDWNNHRFTADVTSAITLKRGLTAPKKYVVLLRDPVSRWVSGFAQYFWGWDPSFPGYYTSLEPDHWFRKVWFDDHTRPQVDFLQGLDKENTIWFDCDRNLSSNVRHWIKDKFDQDIRDLDNDPENAYNVSSRGRPWPTNGITQKQIMDHVRSAMDQNPNYQQSLLEFYHQDVELRAEVEFYGTR